MRSIDRIVNDDRLHRKLTIFLFFSRMSKFTSVFKNIMGMFEQPTPSVVFCASSHPQRKLVTKSGVIDKRRLA